MWHPPRSAVANDGKVWVAGLSIRAVAAGSFAQGASEAGLAQGLRDFGWLVEEVDHGDPFDSRTLVGRLEQRLRARQWAARYNAAIIATCERVRPEVLLTVKGNFISAATLRRVARLDIATVNYFPDYYLSDIPTDALAAYSHVITTKSFQLDHLRRELGPDRAHFVHHGYMPLLHRPHRAPGAPYSADIVYVGNASAYKARMLTPLVEALPDAIIRIFGGNWQPYASTALGRAVVGRRLTPDYMADAISHARVTVALHMGKTSSSVWQDLVSTRTFEIPACGGFMLHIDNDEVRSLFDVSSEIDVFASADELISKTRYYLDHPVEREAIAARGYARAVPAYSYSARASEVAAIVEPLVARR
jgi:spore maturation protein CgeB